MKKSFVSLTLLALSVSAFSQNVFTVSLRPTTTDVNNVKALLRYQQGDVNLGLAVPVVDQAPAGVTSSATFGANVVLDTLTYGILGTYGTQGVTLGVDSTTANALVGQSWDSLINNALYSEANVRAALDSDNVGFVFAFTQFLTTVSVQTESGSRGLFSPLGQDVTLLNFSDARRNGFANVQAVPEPASLAAITVGLAAVVRRRRKQGAK